jgi:hypothetical protein
MWCPGGVQDNSYLRDKTRRMIVDGGIPCARATNTSFGTCPCVREQPSPVRTGRPFVRSATAYGDVEVHGTDDHQHQEHRQPKQDEKDVDTVRAFSEAICVTDFYGCSASFDEQHARVDEDEAEGDQRHNRIVRTPGKRLSTMGASRNTRNRAQCGSFCLDKVCGASHRWSGLMKRWSARKETLTSRARMIRACTA